MGRRLSNSFQAAVAKTGTRVRWKWNKRLWNSVDAEAIAKLRTCVRQVFNRRKSLSDCVEAYASADAITIFRQ